MSRLNIRPALRADISTILTLAIGGNAPGREIVDDPNDSDAAEYQLIWDKIEQDPNNFYVIAEIDEEAVGCMQINIIHSIAGRGKPRVQLEGIHIRSDQRGKGLGSELIQ